MARSTSAAADDRHPSSVTATAAAAAAEEEEEEQEEVAEIWGTWEDLLLACAVNRHGPHSWDSVASDVRSHSRSPSPLSHLLTAAHCRRRYRLLSRRFSSSSSSQAAAASDDPSANIPWLDELRSLRVAELRREVQRYDASIGSLQLKVRRLKEEQQAVDNAANGSGSDPKEENNIVGSLPDTAAGEDSGRSCKESNSTESKLDDEVIKVEERIKQEADPAVNAYKTTTSYNGSSDIRAVRSPVEDPDPIVNESGESVAESKGGEEEDEEGARNNSDVQSSAGLSRRRRRRGRRRVAAGGEVEAEAVSPVHTMVDVESEPLIVFLETVRLSRTGSVFDRRLQSQVSFHFLAIN